MISDRLLRQRISPVAELPERLNKKVSRLDLAALASFLLPFILYTLTLAPTIYNLDSAELTTAAASGGILRATGYPLYLLIGKLWALLPVGDVGYRMNLLSAVCGAGTIFLADQILRRLGVGGWARFGALGLLATAPFVWALSLIAEVYTLHTFLMAAILLSLLQYEEKKGIGRLSLPFLLIGLSLGNHAATVLLIPGVLIYFFVSRPRLIFHRQAILASALALMAGASVYLLLPLRYASDPVFNYAGTFNASGIFNPVDLKTFEGLVWLVTGQAFAGQMFAYRLSELLPEFWNFTNEMTRAFFVFGILPGIVGLIFLTRRHRAIGLALLLMFLANVVFYVNYRVIDKATMFLPAYLIWAIWLGFGFQHLLNWISSLGSSRSIVRIVRSVLVAGVLAAVFWNWSNVDLSNDWSTRRQSEKILQLVENDAIVLGWWDTIPGIQYLQLIEGQRPDVLAINRFLISGEEMNLLILAQVDERPVYINNPSIELLKKTIATDIGPLYKLEGKD